MFRLVIVTPSQESTWKTADVRQRVEAGKKAGLLVPTADANIGTCTKTLKLGVVSTTDGKVKGIEVLIQETLEKAGLLAVALPPVEEEKAVEEEAPQHDWSSMKMSALREFAKERGIKGFKKLKKAELISALGGV